MRQPGVVTAFPNLMSDSASRERLSITVDPRQLKRWTTSSFVLSMKMEGGDGRALAKNVGFLQADREAKFFTG